MTVGQAIYDVLVGDASLMAVSGISVWQGHAPMSTANPLVVFGLTNTIYEYDKEDGKVQVKSYDISIYAATYTQCETVANLVESAINLHTEDYDGFDMSRARIVNMYHSGFDPDNTTEAITLDLEVRIFKD